MAVDRTKRDLIAGKLAQLMRGEILPRDIIAFRKVLFPKREPVSDPLAHHSLTRLDKHWWCASKRARLQCIELQWEKLKRWIAILHTDIDWSQPRPSLIFPPSPPWWWGALGCLGMLATIGLMILAGIVFDGIPIIVWGATSCIMVPIFSIYAYRVSRDETPSEWDKYKPFDAVEQMNASLHFTEVYRLPQYDPRIHGLSEDCKTCRLIQIFPFMALMILAAAAIWPGVLLMTWINKKEDEFSRRSVGGQSTSEPTH